MRSTAFLKSELPTWPVHRGKVRDIYDLGDRLLIVATDRLSAFDWVLPTGIPDRGRVLTQLSRFWFERLGEKHHLITTDMTHVELPPGSDRTALEGRSMLVEKTEVVPVECVVRGYLAGSGWKEYQTSGCVCGVPVRAGLRQADKLPEPIFTPATKAATGHDENISFEQMVNIVGRATAEELRDRSLAVYEQGAAYARERGIIIADTKFEWGRRLPARSVDGRQSSGQGEDAAIILIDEVLTPDSSRFWPADQYRAGISPPSFDKQFVRDWLETTDWDKHSEPPPLPDEIVQRTRAKYIEAYERLTGQAFPWK